MRSRPFPPAFGRGSFQPLRADTLNRLYATVEQRSDVSVSGAGLQTSVSSTGVHSFADSLHLAGFYAKIVALAGQTYSEGVYYNYYSWTQVFEDGDGTFTPMSVEGYDGQSLANPGDPSSLHLPAYEANNQVVQPGTIVRMYYGNGPWMYFFAPLSGALGGGGTEVAQLTSGVGPISGSTPGSGSATFYKMVSGSLVATTTSATVYNTSDNTYASGSWVELVLEPVSATWFIAGAVNNITLNLLTFNYTFVSLTNTTVNNYNVAGVSKIAFGGNSGGSSAISGFARGIQGQILYLWNTGPGPLTIANGAGALGNRVITPLGFAYVLPANAGCILEYDSVVGDGSGNGVWRFDEPTFGAGNLDGSTLVYACNYFRGHNDLGTGHRFGRIEITGGNGVATGDWQGQRAAHNGGVFVGPEPDINYLDSLDIEWADPVNNAGAKTLDIQAFTIGVTGPVIFPENVATVDFDASTCTLTYTTNPTKTLTFNDGLLQGVS